METLLFNPLLQIVFNPVTTPMIIEIVVVIILLFCSAMISGSEVAFFSLTPQEIDYLEENNTRSNTLVLVLLQKPEHLLANILISNNFVNVAIVILSSFITEGLMDASGSPILGFVIQVVFITFMILLFGEIVPKIYADKQSAGFASFMAIPLESLNKVFKPLIYLLTKSTSAVNRAMAGKRQNISMDELSEALDIATGVVSDEKKMLEGIVKFSNLEAVEVMKPRMDVTIIDINTSMEELLNMVLASGYSRIPVYEGKTDNIAGILYVKDLLPHFRKLRFSWQTLIRPPFFVPESKKINDLLKDFQQAKIHLAIVVDEYGGMKGIVSMEDILEEVVGEITDESDDSTQLYQKLDDRTFLFDGKTLLNDYYKISETDDELFDDVKGDAETLAGLILELKGDFPRVNDVLICKNIRFTITDMDKRRIKEIKVYIMEENDNED